MWTYIHILTFSLFCVASMPRFMVFPHRSLQTTWLPINIQLTNMEHLPHTTTIVFKRFRSEPPWEIGSSWWFNSWPFDPRSLEVTNNPLKGSHFHHPQKGHELNHLVPSTFLAYPRPIEAELGTPRRGSHPPGFCRWDGRTWPRGTALGGGRICHSSSPEHPSDMIYNLWKTKPVAWFVGKKDSLFHLSSAFWKNLYIYIYIYISIHLA